MGEVESALSRPSDDSNQVALEHIGRLIADVQPGSMVQAFVLVVEVIDEEDRWLSAYVAPGQKRWSSMGMLDFALTIERNTAIDTRPLDG